MAEQSVSLDGAACELDHELGDVEDDEAAAAVGVLSAGVSGARARSGAARRKCERGPKGLTVPLFNSSHCSYDVVKDAAVARGWKLMPNAAKVGLCSVHWIDQCGVSEWFSKVEPWMRINHFPGMHNALARKSRLARNMARMVKLFPTEYRFVPATWVLPDDLEELSKHFDKAGKSKPIYIVKPDAGTQGRGIFLTTDLDRIAKVGSDRESPVVVQRYIGRPLLIDDLKFDLRLYFLVSGVMSPNGILMPRYFLFNDGLVRLCTQAYVAPTAENLNQKCMHLTNYAVNKKSKDFVQNTDADDDGEGNKRSLRWFMGYIADAYGEPERDKLWKKLSGLCVKTLLPVHPTLENDYHNAMPRDFAGGRMGCRCFEVLGIDVMLDTKLRPYLIEINHLPSFTCDSPLDQDIKQRVVEQTLELTCGTVAAGDRQMYESIAAEARRRQAGAKSADGDSAARPPPDAAADAPHADAAGEAAGPSPLDAPLYCDYFRAFPAPPGTRLEERFEAILSRTRELFRPVAARPPAEAARGRPASGSRKPPALSQSAPAAPPSRRPPARGPSPSRTLSPHPAPAPAEVRAPSCPSPVQSPPRAPPPQQRTSHVRRAGSSTPPLPPDMAHVAGIASPHGRVTCRAGGVPRSSSMPPRGLPAIPSASSSPEPFVTPRSATARDRTVSRRSLPLKVAQITL